MRGLYLVGGPVGVHGPTVCETVNINEDIRKTPFALMSVEQKMFKEKLVKSYKYIKKVKRNPVSVATIALTVLNGMSY